MLKKMSIVFISIASMVEPTTGSSADLRESFLSQCKEQIYQESLREKKLISALSLKIIGNNPKECLERFEEVSRYLVIEQKSYFSNDMKDEDYRQNTLIGLDIEIQNEFSSENLRHQERMRDVKGVALDNSPHEVIKGYTTITN